MRTNRGFTLIELLVAMVIMSIVGVVMVRMMASTQRVTTAQAERASLQANSRIGAFVLPSELLDLNVNALGNDITAMSSTAISYWANRGGGTLCAVPIASTVQIYNNSTFSGRLPVANQGERLYVFVEGPDPNTAADDSWVATGTITSVVANSTCGGGVPTYVYTLTGAPTANVTVGSPVRLQEQMQLGSYTSSGQLWLGLQSLSHGDPSYQPVLGPLTAAGFNLSYRDVNDAVTTDMNAVRSIVVALKGQADRTTSLTGVSTRTLMTDSISTRVSPRNVP